MKLQFRRNLYTIWLNFTRTNKKTTISCILTQINTNVFKIGSWANISMLALNPIFHTLVKSLSWNGRGFSKFRFLWFRLIFGALVARLLDCMDVIFIISRFITINNAFEDVVAFTKDSDIQNSVQKCWDPLLFLWYQYDAFLPF